MTNDLDKCQVQKDFGAGSNSVKKFYFDPNSRRCLPFYYNGRKGNLNRFSSLEICEQECLETNSNFVTEVIVIIIVIIFVIVSLVVAYSTVSNCPVYTRIFFDKKFHPTCSY